MTQPDMRRRSLIARITLILVVLLIFMEALVIFGVFELQSQTVAKYAPWAYEPFLRLIGEHPESAPRWARVEEEVETSSADSSVAGVTGLDSAAIPILIETNDGVLATNRVIEATLPVEVDPTPADPSPVHLAPADEEQEVIPVG